MVDIRIVETFQHVACKLLQFIHRQIECLHQLVKLHLVDILADYLMVAGIAHDVYAAQESHGTQNCVRAIQQRHLTLVIRLL